MSTRTASDHDFFMVAALTVIVSFLAGLATFVL